MKKVFDLRRFIHKLDKDEPKLLVLFAMELEADGKSELLDYQGLTDYEVGLIVGNGYNDKKDNSMDDVFVDENEYKHLDAKEALAYVVDIMMKAVLEDELKKRGSLS